MNFDQQGNADWIGLNRIEQAPGAAVLYPDDGVDYCLFHKDRVKIAGGGNRLRGHRLTAVSPTRRAVAECCNAPMVLDFTSGHWLNIYRDRLGEGAPPLEMAFMAKDRPTSANPPKQPATYPLPPARFMIKLLASWAAMGFRRPKMDW